MQIAVVIIQSKHIWQTVIPIQVQFWKFLFIYIRNTLAALNKQDTYIQHSAIDTMQLNY